MPKWTNIYHRLPYPARVLAASARGYYLRYWRYGKETERLIDVAHARETLSFEKIVNWQKERLAYVLHRAATRVPYYRDYWQARRRQGDRTSWEELKNWPILDKETVRVRGRDLIADDCNIRWMFREATGGTTGTPLNLYIGKKSLVEWYALVEARTRRWYGVSIKDHWGILGGQLVVPFTQQTPPFWVLNYGLNQLYLSTFHISRENAHSYFDELERFSPTHLVVYPSSASALAEAALEHNLKPPSSLQVIISNAELLTHSYRQIISEAFHCPVRNTYGMGEDIVGASECESQSLHLWPEAGKIECFQDEVDYPVTEGLSGRLIITGLINTDMPLIRYDSGDRGRLATSDPSCKCHRNLPRIAALEGRSQDTLRTPEGRRIFWLNPVFYGLPLREAQIVQETSGHIRVRYVPRAGFDQEHAAAIISRLQDRLGRLEISLEEVNSIERLPNGKFRAVISKLV